MLFVGLMGLVIMWFCLCEFRSNNGKGFASLFISDLIFGGRHFPYTTIVNADSRQRFQPRNEIKPLTMTLLHFEWITYSRSMDYYIGLWAICNEHAIWLEYDKMFFIPGNLTSYSRTNEYPGISDRLISPEAVSENVHRLGDHHTIILSDF